MLYIRRISANLPKWRSHFYSHAAALNKCPPGHSQSQSPVQKYPLRPHFSIFFSWQQCGGHESGSSLRHMLIICAFIHANFNTYCGYGESPQICRNDARTFTHLPQVETMLPWAHQSQAPIRKHLRHHFDIFLTAMWWPWIGLVLASHADFAHLSIQISIHIVLWESPWICPK